MHMQEWESEFAWASFPSQVNWPTRGIRSGEGGADALEIVWGIGGSHSVSALRTVWSARSNNGRRNNPVVAIHLAGEDGPASLVGPGREGVLPPVVVVNDIARLTRLLESALARPNRFRAREHLERYLPSVDDPAWGVRNRGLFATHSLLNTPEYHDGWEELAAAGRPMLQSRGSALAEQLGFSITPGGGGRYSILSVEGEPTALGLFLPADEGPRTHVARFGDSPVLYGFRMADEHDLPWIIVNAGNRLQIYSTRPNVGVGRRGRTETYTEVLLDLLAPQDAGYVPLLFSSEALRAGGYLEELIRRSAERVSTLGTRLRDRVYNDVLPSLATGIAVARGLQDPTIDELRTTQGMALSTLFRMLFISYAEDRDLLPYTESAEYQEISLKKLALEWSTEEPEFEESTSALWDRLATIISAVHDGSETLQIPAYGGTPFSTDPDIAPLGHLLGEVQLPDSTFGPALRALITDSSAEEGLGPIDFRELSVREFGTIYEGLLESELTYAETNLATDRQGFYRPADDEEEVIVRAGEFYLSNGGQRKASASYYTKDFSVEHLLERSLEPALDDHLARIDALETDQEKSEAFFDFMIADISMGSGHFLVAAVDRIERRFSSYLDENPLEGVRTELNRLWNLAAEALGKSVDETGINQPMLLRRQIARRCIYGVDLNPTAVELARVSIWIHTFVPGLPLSFLDWHLRQGNSIVGVATQEEAWNLLTRNRQTTLFAAVEFNARERMQEIMNMMIQISRSSDSTTQEVDEARAAHRDAFAQLLPWEILMDIITASRLDSELASNLQQILDQWGANPSNILTSPQRLRAQELLRGLNEFHHQAMFPEVMWRENAGFDVIVGNPPWEKPKVEEHGFWMRYIPSYRSMSQSAKETARTHMENTRPDLVQRLEEERNKANAIRGSILNSNFPGMGTGDPDLYKAFCWRFWNLLRQGGRMGVVVPRSVFQALGSREFRKELFAQATFERLITLVNRGGWVFDDVEPRYSICLVSLNKTEPPENPTIPISGPFDTYESYRSSRNSPPLDLQIEVILNGSDAYSIPLLPSSNGFEAVGVMQQMQTQPRFDSNEQFRFRQVAEFHARGDREFFHLTEPSPENNWPVIGGQSYNIWNSDTGNYFATIDPATARTELQRKRTAARGRSAFAEMSDEWRTNATTLPCVNPRIVFRDVARATDTRTSIAALIPPNRVIVHNSPYLLRCQGSETDEAFLLGILCSIPYDWYCRRYVETHMTYFLQNPLPVPRPDVNNTHRRRLVELAGRLAAQDQRMSEWAASVGVHCGPIDDVIKRNMVLEIDAIVSRLYGLDDGQLRTIYQTFHHDGTVDGEPWEARYNSVMEYYRQLEGEDE